MQTEPQPFFSEEFLSNFIMAMPFLIFGLLAFVYTEHLFNKYKIFRYERKK